MKNPANRAPRRRRAVISLGGALNEKKERKIHRSFSSKMRKYLVHPAAETRFIKKRLLIGLCGSQGVSIRSVVMGEEDEVSSLFHFVRLGGGCETLRPHTELRRREGT